MLIPRQAWKRKIGEPLNSPGICKVTGEDGGLPNIDDGYYTGIPLGGLGAGAIFQSYRGDFSTWHLDIGKHINKTIHSCQFGIFENGKAVILNGNKPEDGSLSTWNFQNPEGNYHALYPLAYFDYTDFDIIQEQFSPVIPNNYQETSYPVAVFKWHISNNSDKIRELSILWSFKSPFGSKENFFYQENSFSGIVFDNVSAEKNKRLGQFGIFSQVENTEVSYITQFSDLSDGSELWEPFSKRGVLVDSDDVGATTNIPNAPGAISSRIKINPKDKKTVTFILVWDFPIVEFGEGSRWYKHYTKFFGRDGRNVTKIARKAFGENEKWYLEIKKWQEEILKTNKPDWFKTLLINEVYYNAAGGTFWTCGKVPNGEESTSSGLKSVVRLEEHFGLLECHDYPFYETLDVRFYGSFPLLILWPQLEKVILKDYLKTVDLEIKEEKFFNHPLAQYTSQIKVKGALPHDLGSPKEDPFIKVNSYPHTDINRWKDLNSKFVLLIYRYFCFTGKKDMDFLNLAWGKVVNAINYLKKFDTDQDCLIENENMPDQTYDNWVMSGPGSYCNGLWLAALKALIEMGKLTGKDCSEFEKWFNLGKKSLEEKLWNEEYYLFDTNPVNRNSIMADALCGQWYADLLGLGDIYDFERVNKTLKNIFNKNVIGIENGTLGAINGICLDGSYLPESKIWKQNTQWNEIWTGVTLALASHLELRGLKNESLKTAHGIYSTVYERKGYWFRIPEAWDINGNFRASMYHRTGAIWAFLFKDSMLKS